MKLLVVGVDCATDDAKVGLALADYDSGQTRVREVVLGSRQRPASSIIAAWLRGVKTPALLAIDAPLGWPAPLAHTLANHAAGEALGTVAHIMFRRATDCFIRTHLFKTPLDVGADRIARTAHSALSLFAELRTELGIPLPLAWAPPISGVAAIEVYPAATLVARRYRSIGYKKPHNKVERREIASSVRREMDIGTHGPTLENSADALDAVICALAAKDFIEGRAMAPNDPSLARREGWIWAAPRISKDA